MSEGARRSRAWPLLFAGLALVYLYFIPYFPALNNPNENSRVYQIRAAVELHKLSVNEQIARYGMVNDLGKRDGAYYAGKAPGTTFIGVPIYAALRSVEAARGHAEVSPFRLLYTLRLFGTIAPVLAFLHFFRRFLLRYMSDEPVANALTAILALGSMMLPYALLFVNHSLSAAAAFGAVIATEAARRSQGRERARKTLAFLALAGFLASMASALDYALLPISLMVVVYAVLTIGLKPLSLALLALGGLIPAIATGIYHTICWGGPFKLSMSYLANPEFASNHSKGLFGIVGMTRASIAGILWTPSKGILYLSPIFALALAASIAACKLSKERRLAILCLAVTLWMLVYAGSLVNWDAGWTVGPRYMTACLPFAFFSMALTWEALHARAKAVLLPLGIGLGIASVTLMTAASTVFPHFPPEYKNPVFELVWPLWRDAMTPHSLGHSLLGLTGRAAQAPLLLVLVAILLYLVWVASGSILYLSPQTSTSRRMIASALAAAAVAAIYLGLASLPRTEPKRVVDAGMVWLRKSVWEPPITLKR